MVQDKQDSLEDEKNTSGGAGWAAGQRGYVVEQAEQVAV